MNDNSTEILNLACGGAKALSNTDREQLIKLQEVIKSTVLQLLQSFIGGDVVATLSKQSVLIQNKDEIPEVRLVSPDHYLLHLQDYTEFGLIKEIIEFSEYFRQFLVTINKSLLGHLKPEDSQAALVEWQGKIKKLLCAVKSTKNFQVNVFEELERAVSDIGKSVETSLQSCVNSQAVDEATRCLRLVELKLLTQDGTGGLTTEILKEFGEHMEQAGLMSSVLGDNGCILRKGLSIVNSAIHGRYGLCVFGTAVGDDSKEMKQKITSGETNAVKHLMPLMKSNETDKLRADLCECLTFMKYHPEGDKSIEDLGGFIVDQMKKLWADAKTVMTNWGHSFHDEYVKANDFASSLQVPDKVAKLSESAELAKIQPDVAKMFPEQTIRKAVEICDIIEKLISRLESLSKDVTCSPGEIFDMGKLVAVRHNCWTWL